MYPTPPNLLDELPNGAPIDDLLNAYAFLRAARTYNEGVIARLTGLNKSYTEHLTTVRARLLEAIAKDLRPF